MALRAAWAATFAAIYPVFTGGMGRGGLSVYYALCGAQVAAALAFWRRRCC